MQTCAFHDYDINSRLQQKRKIRTLIKTMMSQYKVENFKINYIFCSDEYLLEMNKKYLDHDTLTDIITFNLSEKDSELLLSDIYISIERVKENAEIFKKSYAVELLRVMIHGILHLIGYADQTKKEKSLMRSMESRWINRYVKDILPK